MLLLQDYLCEVEETENSKKLMELLESSNDSTVFVYTSSKVLEEVKQFVIANENTEEFTIVNGYSNLLEFFEKNLFKEVQKKGLEVFLKELPLTNFLELTNRLKNFNTSDISFICGMLNIGLGSDFHKYLIKEFKINSCSSIRKIIDAILNNKEIDLLGDNCI